MKAARKFLALDWRDKLLHLEAWCCLGAVRLALWVVPFRRIAPHLGRQIPPGQDEPISEMPAGAARKIGVAVERMAHHTPWESACLAQAVAGKYMLRRRGLPSRLYLGTRKDETGKLTAHAWLRSGSEIVVGGAGHQTFTVLSAFADPGS